MSQYYIFSKNKGFYHSKDQSWHIDCKSALAVAHNTDPVMECGRIDASVELGAYIKHYDKQGLVSKFAKVIANCQDSLFEKPVVDLFSQNGMRYCDKGIWLFNGKRVSNGELAEALEDYLEDKVESIIEPLARYEQGTELLISDDKKHYWHFVTPF